MRSSRAPPKHSLSTLLQRRIVPLWTPAKHTLWIQKTDDFLDIPNVVANTRFHRGSDAQSLVNAAKVIKHKVERQCRDMILYLLAECVCEPCESPHGHAHS